MEQNNHSDSERIQAALNRLFSLHQFGMKLGLDNMTALLAHIGNPQAGLKMFHIAGSNGKGSTASFIASILMEAGFKVGLYTSPHFIKFNERIRINGIMIDDNSVAEFVEGLNEYISEKKPTFFELTTALAFYYFKSLSVDYAVIETGLGGRLDATNVITPLASVITSISLDHTEHLGETIEKIASEKGGIIKPGVKLLTGIMPAGAQKVLKKKAAENQCSYFAAEIFVKKADGFVSLDLGTRNFTIYSTPLKGEHQLYNAALAVKTVGESLVMREGPVLSAGIKNVLTNTGIEGRYETVNENPRIIFDSAHNTEGIDSFINEFSKEFKNYEERVLIFGAMRDKSIEAMLGRMKSFFTRVYLTAVDIERAATADELKNIAEREGIKAEITADPVNIIADFYKHGRGQCLVVAGSMYLLGEIKSKLFVKRLDKLIEGD